MALENVIMKGPLKMYINRKTYYSAADRTAQQYKITIIPIPKRLSKIEQSEILKGSYLNNIKEINFAKKISQKNSEILLSNNIFSIGLLKDKTKNLTIDNTKEANFLFIDFEEQKDTTKQIISFEKCKEILEENNLNYILKTSSSHTKEKPRLHLFLPLLKPIKTDEEYKYNLQLIQEKYFNNFGFDKKTKNISRWVYASNSDTVQFAFCFEKNDIQAEKVDKHLLELEKSTPEHHNVFKLDEENLNNFTKQVKSLYGFEYIKYDPNGIIKFRRDRNDKIPNVWYSSQYYNNKTNEHTVYDKKGHNVLFSYEDFENSINPEKERNEIQTKLKEEMNNWFIDGGKKYIVTNEGLGKSSTILKMGKQHSFLFVCHTTKRINEISSSMVKEKIEHKVILSNTQILEEFNLFDSAKKYMNQFNGNKERSFKQFINDEVTDVNLKFSILKRYNENFHNLKNTNIVRLITSKKLQVEIERESLKNGWFIDDHIIFDEFIFDEWSIYKAPEDGEEIISKMTIWNNEKSYISLTENSSFINLLVGCNNILILTTERSLIEQVFYDSDYREMRIFEMKQRYTSTKYGSYSFLKFERKLYDDNVSYVLTSSTRSGETRDTLIKTIKSKFEEKFKEEFEVISNKAELRDYTHAGVKGSNEFSNKNLIIVGTLRTENEDNILYYSCPKFFNDYKNYLEKKYEKKTKDEREKNIKSDILSHIVQTQLQTQVSQSIGRNSGFRDKGKKTVVILPLLMPGSSRIFKPIELNYISPNVEIFDLKHLSKS